MRAPSSVTATTLSRKWPNYVFADGDDDKATCNHHTTLFGTQIGVIYLAGHGGFYKPNALPAPQLGQTRACCTPRVLDTTAPRNAKIVVPHLQYIVYTGNSRRQPSLHFILGAWTVEQAFYPPTAAAVVVTLVTTSTIPRRAIIDRMLPPYQSLKPPATPLLTRRQGNSPTHQPTGICSMTALLAHFYSCSA